MTSSLTPVASRALIPTLPSEYSPDATTNLILALSESNDAVTNEILKTIQTYQRSIQAVKQAQEGLGKENEFLKKQLVVLESKARTSEQLHSSENKVLKQLVQEQAQVISDMKKEFSGIKLELKEMKDLLNKFNNQYVLHHHDTLIQGEGRKIRSEPPLGDGRVPIQF